MTRQSCFGCIAAAPDGLVPGVPGNCGRCLENPQYAAVCCECEHPFPLAEMTQVATWRWGEGVYMCRECHAAETILNALYA